MPLNPLSEPTSVPKLLVVDDLAENLFAMQKLLKPLQAEVLTAQSGNKALALTLHNDFAVALLDVQMPEMDGFELASLMRDHDLTQHIPIIFLTAISKEEKHIFEGYEKGAVDYLFKPIDPQILLSKVKTFLLLQQQRIALKRSEDRYKCLVEGIPDIIYSFSGKRGNTYCSSQVKQILGYTPEQLLKDPFIWSKAIHADDLPMVNKAIKRFYEGNHFDIEYRIKDAAGKWAWLRDRSIDRRIEESEPIIDGIATDITLRKKAEVVLTRIAEQDQLTNLATRKVFNEFQQRATSRAKRYHRSMAVLFMDMDHFKEVNDNFGHAVGDTLLKSVAKRLTDCVRSSDLVARLGGDEFAIVLDELSRPEDAADVAQKILESMGRPHLIEGHRIKVGISIGIAIYSKALDNSVDELNKMADIAMYHAKKTGRNTFQFFSEEMHEKALHNARLKKDLGTAIENHELFLIYQPQIDLNENRISGFEALLRWRHPQLGKTAPDDFIHLAEEKGLIHPIGEWVLKEACQNSALFPKDRPQIPGTVGIAVNVSPKQLRERFFADAIERILTDASIAPEQLTIELTEATVIESPEPAREMLRRIRALGVRIAIDNFGKGYSSLSYLADLPVDIIKIDISFVNSIGHSKDHEAIVKTIITMADNLGLEVVAEGVETALQTDFLSHHHCHIMQGYYFSRPLAPEDASRLMNKPISVGSGHTMKGLT
ncbi:MAG: EAL domain-containing protein [Deltaproteobacteria bacterium]|nr:EAL domain-containing protein [Deltaproteobacteria bacterium]